MELLFEYKSNKKIKRDLDDSTSSLQLFYDGININLIGEYVFNYTTPYKVSFTIYKSAITLNVNTGDFNLLHSSKYSKSENKVKKYKNNFKQLNDISDYGIRRGEGRLRYWGVKYENAVEEVYQIMLDILKPKFKSEFYLNQTVSGELHINFLYDMIVNYHLDKKNIKGHDAIYSAIQDVYPKKKWLKKNDNKYVPAVLDSLSIKTNYYISEITKRQSPIMISSLNYLCKLFGDNHVNYMQRIPWHEHCVFTTPPNKKIHVLKNDNEKKCLISLIKNWDGIDELIHKLNSLFTLREKIESKGINTKFNVKTFTDLLTLEVKWKMIDKHLKRGFKLRYDISKKFVKYINAPIKTNTSVFKPKILLSEDDFFIEGIKMSNCMCNQFMNGILNLFISMSSDFGKTINLNFSKKGELIASYAKANTDVPEIFKEPIRILTERIKLFEGIEWTKEKYDSIL
jgi:hypothetical protein